MTTISVDHVKFPAHPPRNVQEARDQLRDFIISLPAEAMNMGTWDGGREEYPRATARELLHDCKSAHCIGGWAGALFGKPSVGSLGLDHADNILGLNSDNGQRELLFYPNYWSWNIYTKAEIDHAVTTFAETGFAEWPKLSQAEVDVRADARRERELAAIAKRRGILA